MEYSAGPPDTRTHRSAFSFRIIQIAQIQFHMVPALLDVEDTEAVEHRIFGLVALVELQVVCLSVQRQSDAASTGSCLGVDCGATRHGLLRQV